MADRKAGTYKTGMRYGFQLPVPCRLPRPFKARTGKWVRLLS